MLIESGKSYMSTIIDEKEKLIKLKEEVIKKAEESAYRYTRKIFDIHLVSIDNNIALWAVEHLTGHGSLYSYIYTDLNGNILFNNEIFKYAAPFSNQKAIVKIMHSEWLIIDLEKKEIVSFPHDLTFRNINRFKNNCIPLFDKEKKKWGGYQYNEEDKTFSENIPFIWDALDFSRSEGEVYVGISNVTAKICNHPYFHSDEDFGVTLNIGAIKIPINRANNYDNYQNWLENYCRSLVRWICEEYRSREEGQKHLEEFIRTAHNIGDYYFGEQYRKEYNTNNNTIVDVGKLEDYKRVLGKIRK
jgi:hypothetical protein